MIDILYCNENDIIKTLSESLVIGGLPKRADKLTKEGLTSEIDNLYIDLKYIWDNKDNFIFDVKEKKIINKTDTKYKDEYLEKNVNIYFKRGITLGNVPIGSGHNSLFKGVSFNMIIEFPLYWLKEYQRYHFTDIVSSQSTMHKINEFSFDEMFKDEVDDRVIEIMKELREKYNQENDTLRKKEIWRKIINTCPCGLHMVMGIQMNYLQAQSIVNQRRTHKLSEWKDDFVPFLENLPYYNLFLGV